jgi:hypothetical protein
MSLTKQSLEGKNVIKLFPAREGLVSDIPPGEWGREKGKPFLQCRLVPKEFKDRANKCSIVIVAVVIPQGQNSGI